MGRRKMTGPGQVGWGVFFFLSHITFGPDGEFIAVTSCSNLCWGPHTNVHIVFVPLSTANGTCCIEMRDDFLTYCPD